MTRHADYAPLAVADAAAFAPFDMPLARLSISLLLMRADFAPSLSCHMLPRRAMPRHAVFFRCHAA